MKTFSEFGAIKGSVIDRLEKFLGHQLKPGMTKIAGFQVKLIDEHEHGDWLEFEFINQKDRKPFSAAMKKAGFKLKAVGQDGIIIS